MFSTSFQGCFVSIYLHVASVLNKNKTDPLRAANVIWFFRNVYGLIYITYIVMKIIW